MSSTFLFHPLMTEVVPYNAVYDFPSQATRSSKRTVKITPKNNAASYVSGSTIRFEFPASGYLNTNTTYLAFNCRQRIPASASTALYSNGTATLTSLPGFAFQNNISSIFRRVRVLYGSIVLEDIQDYNILQRMFTETLTASGSINNATSMYQGIGNNSRRGGITADNNFSRYNYHTAVTDLSSTAAANQTALLVGGQVRRYAIPINTGLFQQRRLIPLKFMSSQFSIEFELAEAIDCQIEFVSTGAVNGGVPTAAQTEVGLPELVTELLEFDSEFDVAVMAALGKGLPIPYQSWHMSSFNLAVGISQQVNIQESARSVRYALAALTDDNFRKLTNDAHVFVGGWYAQQANASALYDTAATNLATQAYSGTLCSMGSLLESFQWRLGGVYYPSQPVPCWGGQTSISSAVDANYADPPVEAYSELMKVFDNQFAKRGGYNSDYLTAVFSGKRNSGTITNLIEINSFVMAADFLTDRGDVIGGINAEEQNDMMLMLKFTGTTDGTNAGTSKVLRVAVCYDNLMILGESNNMVLVN